MQGRVECGSTSCDYCVNATQPERQASSAPSYVGSTPIVSFVSTIEQSSKQILKGQNLAWSSIMSGRSLLMEAATFLLPPTHHNTSQHQCCHPCKISLQKALTFTSHSTAGRSCIWRVCFATGHLHLCLECPLCGRMLASMSRASEAEKLGAMQESDQGLGLSAEGCLVWTEAEAEASSPLSGIMSLSLLTPAVPPCELLHGQSVTLLKCLLHCCPCN